MIKAPIITKRLSLRQLLPSDSKAIISILMNDCVKKTYMLPDFPTADDALSLFNRLLALSEDPGRYVFGIALQDKIIGFMNDVEIKDGNIEVGYVIAPDYHNHGYATEALTALIDHLHQAGFHTVIAGFFEENIASRRVMEKAGMTQTAHSDNIEYRGKVHRCIYFEHKNTNVL